jgi:tetratricopeptide (TPR) repeat protein
MVYSFVFYWLSLTLFPRAASALALLCYAALPLPATNLGAQVPSELIQVESLIRAGKSDQAITLLKPILEQTPDDPRARNLLGLALTSQGDLPAANREFAQALKSDPKFYPALQNLAANEYALKDFAASEQHFRAAVEFVPEDPSVNSFVGKLTFKRNDYAEAAKFLRKAAPLFSQEPALAVALIQSELEIGKDDLALSQLQKYDFTTASLRARFQLGIALASHGYEERAIPFFEFVQKQYPDSYDAAFNLALCYVAMKRFIPAIELLTGLKQKGKVTAELDNLLAEAYKGAEQIQPAIDALREATRLDPQDETNYIDLAALCTDHEAYDLGLEIIAVGLHYNPQSDRLIFQRGILHAMMNQFDLADQDFQLAAQLAPDNNLTYAGLSVSYMQIGNLPEAVRTLRERISEKPADSTLLYLLGEALIRAGAAPDAPEFVEAKASLERSIALNPAFVPPKVDLAKLYLRENRVDQAVILLEKARSLDPNEKAIYSQLATAYRRQKKTEQAAAALATLTRLNEDQRERDSHKRIRLVRQDQSGQQNP